MKTVIHYKDGPYLPITETWIYGQIKNLKRYYPIVYATSIENIDIFPTEEIRNLELNKKLKDPFAFFNAVWNKSFHFYPSFAFSLMIDRPSLVHAHFGPSGYSFLPHKRTFKLPLITTFYGYDLSLLPSQNPKWKIKYNKLFKEGELFLTEGNHMKKELIKLGCPEDKIIVQHLGVDLKKIKLISRTYPEDGNIIILFVGTFKEKKGIIYAIRAFANVKANHPNIHLRLIGDGEMRVQVESIIKKLGISESVTLLGYQSHDLFLKEAEKAHIFMLPSITAKDGDTEGGAPVAIIEAQAIGLPVISSYHADIPEVVVNGKSALLAPEKDVENLTKHLEYLVEHPNIWDVMGRAGRKHIEMGYDLTVQGEKLEAIYDKIC